MGSFGMGEMLIVFIIALIIFGPRKLPELGKALGKSINEFKKASNDLRSTIEEEIRMESEARPAPPPASTPAEPQILPPTEPVQASAPIAPDSEGSTNPVEGVHEPEHSA
jgi:sec-independent protein translocase protein TatA